MIVKESGNSFMDHLWLPQFTRWYLEWHLWFMYYSQWTRDVESESPGVRVLARSPSLPFEGDSDSGYRPTPWLYIELIYLLIWMSFRSKAILAAPSVVHLIRRIWFSPFIMKYIISMTHMTFWSWSRSPASLGPESESGVLNFLTPESESHKK